MSICIYTFSLSLYIYIYIQASRPGALRLRGAPTREVLYSMTRLVVIAYDSIY